MGKPQNIRLKNVCPQVEELERFAAGELEPAGAESIEAHLDACSDCHQRLVGLLRTGARSGSETAESRDYLLRACAPGRRIADRYRILEFVGSGGMGQVYRVLDEVLDEQVALKFLPPDIAGTGEEGLSRFKSEVLLARRIGHPNVCRVFDLGTHQVESSVDHFLSMELLRGGSLRSAITGGRLRRSDVAPIASQLVAGLAAAHACGILHRDFKSDNVLFRQAPGCADNCPVAVITDFGLARVIRVDRGHTTTHSPLVGTVAYMAPEQVQGGRLGPATDVYGLGVVLFEMLTGSLPFRGTTGLVTAAMHLEHAAPRPSSLAADIAPAWDALVLDCLAKDPAARPTTAQLLSALDAKHPPQWPPNTQPDSFSSLGKRAGRTKFKRIAWQVAGLAVAALLPSGSASVQSAPAATASYPHPAPAFNPVVTPPAAPGRVEPVAPAAASAPTTNLVPTPTGSIASPVAPGGTRGSAALTTPGASEVSGNRPGRAGPVTDGLATAPTPTAPRQPKRPRLARRQNPASKRDVVSASTAPPPLRNRDAQRPRSAQEAVTTAPAPAEPPSAGASQSPQSDPPAGYDVFDKLLDPYD